MQILSLRKKTYYDYDLLILFSSLHILVKSHDLIVGDSMLIINVCYYPHMSSEISSTIILRAIGFFGNDFETDCTYVSFCECFGYGLDVTE